MSYFINLDTCIWYLEGATLSGIRAEIRFSWEAKHVAFITSRA